MTLLAICSQDINSITLGLKKDGDFIERQFDDIQPDDQLKMIDIFLSEQNALLDDLTGIVVVTGPGSFTASRTSVVIANTIGFTKSIPIWGVENVERHSLADVVQSIDFSKLPEIHHFVSPSYDRPARIT
jgi:tRNA A37 threonylcarbamoyladenosine modification protein TsaB